MKKDYKNGTGDIVRADVCWHQKANGVTHLISHGDIVWLHRNPFQWGGIKFINLEVGFEFQQGLDHNIYMFFFRIKQLFVYRNEQEEDYNPGFCAKAAVLAKESNWTKQNINIFLCYVD